MFRFVSRASVCRVSCFVFVVRCSCPCVVFRVSFMFRVACVVFVFMSSVCRVSCFVFHVLRFRACCVFVVFRCCVFSVFVRVMTVCVFCVFFRVRFMVVRICRGFRASCFV